MQPEEYKNQAERSRTFDAGQFVQRMANHRQNVNLNQAAADLKLKSVKAESREYSGEVGTTSPASGELTLLASENLSGESHLIMALAFLNKGVAGAAGVPIELDAKIYANASISIKTGDKTRLFPVSRCHNVPFAVNDATDGLEGSNGALRMIRAASQDSPLAVVADGEPYEIKIVGIEPGVAGLVAGKEISVAVDSALLSAA